MGPIYQNDWDLMFKYLIDNVLFFSSEVGKATMEEEVHQSKGKEVSALFPLKKTLLFAINISSKNYKNSL